MRFSALFMLFFTWSVGSAQSIIGAWEREHSIDLMDTKSYMIVTDGYVVTTTVELETGGFISTRLEKWELLDSSTFKVRLEFDTEYPEAVGGEYEAEIQISEQLLVLDEEEWMKIDSGINNLSGIWRMTETLWDGNRIEMDQDHPRRAIKVLSDTRFQWIDYDQKTRIFSASGGGTYSLEEGVYKEVFEFFTNQPTWIGDSTSFKCRVEGDVWYHLGVLPDEMVVDEIWRNLE